ncbi:MAG TPA: ribosome maturation factor RimM [Capillimicrobium sp.]|nr:ribosome maturation factor RimM [Capillimicrobium sp.]
MAGVVGRPHGLDGSFHVSRARPELLPLGAPVRVGGEVREIQRRAGTDDRPILRLAGCATRTDAEALRGQEIYVPRELAPPLGEDEFWAEDLVGCRVVDGTTAVGVVEELLAYPSCEVLEVAREGSGGSLLVPLVRDAIRSIDVAARQIDIDLAFLGEE